MPSTTIPTGVSTIPCPSTRRTWVIHVSTVACTRLTQDAPILVLAPWGTAAPGRAVGTWPWADVREVQHRVVGAVWEVDVVEVEVDLAAVVEAEAVVVEAVEEVVDAVAVAEDDLESGR